MENSNSDLVIQYDARAGSFEKFIILLAVLALLALGYVDYMGDSSPSTLIPSVMTLD